MPAVEIALIQLASNSPRPDALSSAAKDWANDLTARSAVRLQNIAVNMMVDPLGLAVTIVFRRAGAARVIPGVR
jgi:hypothetical protein